MVSRMHGTRVVTNGPFTRRPYDPIAAVASYISTRPAGGQSATHRHRTLSSFCQGSGGGGRRRVE